MVVLEIIKKIKNHQESTNVCSRCSNYIYCGELARPVSPPPPSEISPATLITIHVFGELLLTAACMINDCSSENWRALSIWINLLTPHPVSDKFGTSAVRQAVRFLVRAYISPRVPNLLVSLPFKRENMKLVATRLFFSVTMVSGYQQRLSRDTDFGSKIEKLLEPKTYLVNQANWRRFFF